MNYRTRDKIKRLESIIKEQKKIIAKRNLLFHNARIFYRKPENILPLMVAATDLRIKWKREDFYIMDLLLLQHGKTFLMTFADKDIDELLAKYPQFQEKTITSKTRIVNRLIKHDYIRRYKHRGRNYYFVTAEGDGKLKVCGKEMMKAMLINFKK